MVGSVQIENDFIIGGGANARVTPNFRLKEFYRSNRKVRVHRELAAALQILRENLAASIKIDPRRPATVEKPADDGLYVVIGADDPEHLHQAAIKLLRQGYFSRCEPLDDQLYVEMPDPAKLPQISPKTAFDCGMKVTAAFETSGDPYQQVTGNFDKAGLSFGPLQCNLKTGTLQELFRYFRGEDESRLQRCFADPQDYLAFWKVLDGSRSKAVAWADDLSLGSGKHGFAQPWKGYLQAVGREPVFRQVMLRYAYDKYGKLLMSALAFLHGVSPVKIRNLRCLAALYDMGVQQGSLKKAYTAIKRRVAREQPEDEFALTRIAVEERAKKASPRWRADCLSRRLCILERQPVSVTLNGQRARRSNRSSYLLRDSGVKGLDRYLAG
ncbi:MAG: hypothetical protein B6D79_16410 [gamma proteobacterium symbiont of Ctena orbiculata]|nr:MAG: hypothetical protein B6D79_16410 [gamma proteobacterium symbiont of Ctena orbiculata]